MIHCLSVSYSSFSSSLSHTNCTLFGRVLSPQKSLLPQICRHNVQPLPIQPSLTSISPELLFILPTLSTSRPSFFPPHDIPPNLVLWTFLRFPPFLLSSNSFISYPIKIRDTHHSIHISSFPVASLSPLSPLNTALLVLPLFCTAFPWASRSFFWHTPDTLFQVFHSLCSVTLNSLSSDQLLDSILSTGFVIWLCSSSKK